MRNNPQIFDEWVEALADIDPYTAFENYKIHRASAKWFPDIADIIRLDPNQYTDHERLRLETEAKFREMDEWEQQALPECPEHLRPKLLGRVVGD